MKLIELKCKNCGSKLKVAEDSTDIICQFCGANFKIDDEVVHHKIDDAEAKEEKEAEEYARKMAIYREEQKRKNLKWWIIGWIFCFPIPLTILIWRSKWEQKKKIIVTAVLWIFILIIGLTNNSTSNENISTNTTNSSNTSEIDTNKEKEIELFGNNKAYFDNEKNIRLFVIGYNNISSNKVIKVEWRNNHKMAYLKFNDETCEINDHNEKGFIITCNFADGKEKLSAYESILLDMLKSKINNIDIENAKSKLLEAKNNNMSVINITDNITIEYNYLKEAISLRAADSYIIKMIIGKEET